MAPPGVVWTGAPGSPRARLLPWAWLLIPGAHNRGVEVRGSQEVWDRPTPGLGGPDIGGPLVRRPHQGCALPRSCPSARTGGHLHLADQLGPAVFLLLGFVTRLFAHSLCPTVTPQKLPGLKNNGLPDGRVPLTEPLPSAALAPQIERCRRAREASSPQGSEAQVQQGLYSDCVLLFSRHGFA